MDTVVRERKITQTSIIGIIANVFLAAFKAMIGLLSGSIAVTLDAVNNLTDAISSVITIIGVKIARRKPDNDHPFGHGRWEYFSAILIAIVIIVAGVTSLIESVKKIISPEAPDFSIWSIVIIAVAVVVKLVLGRFVKARGKKYNSDALVASGSDASFDAIISASTLLGALLLFIFHVSLDGYIGAVIAIFIIKAGIEMLMESVSDIVGNRPDSEVTKAIKDTVRGIDGVLGVYDLILHNYGPNSAIGSLHVEVAGESTAEEIHQLTRKIQSAVLKEFNIFVTVGIYAVNQSQQDVYDRIREVVLKHDGALGVHGIFIGEDEASFDITIDFTVKDRAEFIRTITQEVGDILPGKSISINLDPNFSD
ncbi:MAG: cation transporter [Clostridia bacterium]|nr:cation transporter [Clostridia bacterium]